LFPEGNLRALKDVETMNGDLLDAVVAKYSGIFVLPVTSPNLSVLGQSTLDRMDYNAAGVRASFVPDMRTITITASNPSVVPITGLCSDSSEVYGGQCISHISIGAGESVTHTIQ